MSLPVRTSIDDVEVVCRYLAGKPTGSTVTEARKVLDRKHLDGRKLAGMKAWGLIHDEDGRLKITERGRQAARSKDGLQRSLRAAVEEIPPYRAIVERAAHKGETATSATDVAAHWHEHFSDLAGNSDATLNTQAVCYFQVLEGAGLGFVTVGRRGSPTRIDWDLSELHDFVGAPASSPSEAKAVVAISEPTLTQTVANERELLRVPLPNNRTVRLLVNGDLSGNDIDHIVAFLQVVKNAFASDPGGESGG